MSPELRQDLEALQKMIDELSPEERAAPVNNLTSVKQVAVCGFAMACQLQAIAEAQKGEAK